MPYPFETARDLPKMIDPDDPLRKRPAREMTHFVLFFQIRSSVKLTVPSSTTPHYSLSTTSSNQKTLSHRALDLSDPGQSRIDRTAGYNIREVTCEETTWWGKYILS